MSNRLIDVLLRLAPRERMLIGVLFVLVLPAAVGLGLLWPLTEERRAAVSELDNARALDDWVLARQAELASLARPGAAAEVSAAIGASAVEQSLIDRSLRTSLSRLESRGGGEIALQFDEVPFSDLMRWLDAEDPGWGYTIAELRLRRTDRSAYVAAQLTLLPATDP